MLLSIPHTVVEAFELLDHAERGIAYSLTFKYLQTGVLDDYLDQPGGVRVAMHYAEEKIAPILRRRQQAAERRAAKKTKALASAQESLTEQSAQVKEPRSGSPLISPVHSESARCGDSEISDKFQTSDTSVTPATSSPSSTQVTPIDSGGFTSMPSTPSENPPAQGKRKYPAGPPGPDEPLLFNRPCVPRHHIDNMKRVLRIAMGSMPDPTHRYHRLLEILHDTYPGQYVDIRYDEFGHVALIPNPDTLPPTATRLRAYGF